MLHSNSFIDDIAKNCISKLKDYHLEIGVIAGKTKRKFALGITNAELMFIHENGSPLRNIPARPVLQMAIDYANKNLLSSTIDRCLELALSDSSDSEIEKELDRLALRIQSYARKIIYSNDGRLVPNSLSVQRAKGLKVDKTGGTLINHPLFDTGQLARSITCRVVKS